MIQVGILVLATYSKIISKNSLKKRWRSISDSEERLLAKSESSLSLFQVSYSLAITNLPLEAHLLSNLSPSNSLALTRQIPKELRKQRMLVSKVSKSERSSLYSKLTWRRDCCSNLYPWMLDWRTWFYLDRKSTWSPPCSFCLRHHCSYRPYPPSVLFHTRTVGHRPHYIWRRSWRSQCSGASLASRVFEAQESGQECGSPWNFYRKWHRSGSLGQLWLVIPPVELRLLEATARFTPCLLCYDLLISFPLSGVPKMARAGGKAR